MPKSILRYALGGLLIGGFWYLNRERPPWEEALRTIMVFAAFLTFLKARLKRKSVELHLLPLFLAKLALIGIATTAQIYLASKVGDPALFVAIGLGLAVALIGPAGDSIFFSQAPGAAHKVGFGLPGAAHGTSAPGPKSEPRTDQNCG